MTLPRFPILILFIALTGWSACHVLGGRDLEKRSLFEQFFLTFLTGFGVSSILLFLIAIVGWFEVKVLLIAFFVLNFLCAAVRPSRIREFFSIRFVRHLLCCLLFAFCCLGLGKLAKPYEALIQADDASIYIGAAFQLAKSGNLSYTDPLVTEMTQEERIQIFNNRLAMDTTGQMIRFPGGVRLVDSKKGSVVFSFYHLFPVWLALGILVFGELSFLKILTLFLALQLILLFLIAKELGGKLLGISVPLVSFFFFPQLYFSLIPTSEFLAQTLFLSGLWIFFSGLKSRSILTSSHQFLVAILWGALFLCRLEVLLMLSLSLILLFTLLRSFSMNWSQWRILILLLLFFILLALYYQIMRGDYLYVLTSGLFLGNQTIVLIGIEILNSAIQFVQKFPVYGFLTFIGVAVIVLTTVWRILRNQNQRPGLTAILGVVFIAVPLAAMIGPWASWPRFVRHVTWFSLYFSPAIALTLFCGILFYLYRAIREKSNALWTLFVLFALPAMLYLIRPLIIIDQPWAIRKFVPMVFPLFFLISLSGWFYYLKGIFVRHHYFPKAAFITFIVMLTIFFWSKSQFLLRDKLFANMITQISTFASTIPQNGLIVVPESWAGTHLQIPLQYVTGRNTILLPIEKVRNKRLQNSLNSFLAHQIERRPVIVLMDPSWDRPVALKEFKLTSVNEKSLSFEHVPRIPKMKFPDHSETVSLNYAVFSLSEKNRKNDERVVIPYDDPNVTFVSFHRKENGFRWTQEKSMIRDLNFPMKKAITIIVFTIPEYDIHKESVELRINDQISARLLRIENGAFFFYSDETKLNEITSVTIASKTFVPSEKGLNLDPRRLGICFTKLTLQPSEIIHH